MKNNLSSLYRNISSKDYDSLFYLVSEAECEIICLLKVKRDKEEKCTEEELGTEVAIMRMSHKLKMLGLGTPGIGYCHGNELERESFVGLCKYYDLSYIHPFPGVIVKYNKNGEPIVSEKIVWS